LLYFTTNFCESTFSISLPPAERVGLDSFPPPWIGSNLDLKVDVFFPRRRNLLSQKNTLMSLPVHIFLLEAAADYPMRDAPILDMD